MRSSALNRAPEAGMQTPVVVGLVVVCLYLMFSPVWMPDIAPRMYDNARILQLLSLFAVSLFVLAPACSANLASAWLALPQKVRFLLLTLGAFGLVSALVSRAPHLGLIQFGLVTQLFFLFLTVRVAVGRLGEKAEILLASSAAVGAGLVVVEFWLTYVQALAAGKPFSWVSPFLDFANVRFFGQYQAYVLLLLTLPMVLARLSLSWRIMLYLVAANAWALQWMVGSRAVWVGLVAALAVVAVFMRSGRRRWFLEQGGILLAGGAIFWAFSTFILSSPGATTIPAINSIAERGTESVSARITLGKSALGMIAEHPLTGVGPGQFGLNYGTTQAAHPHNTPLQLVAEYGLVAGLSGVLLGIIILVYAIRELRRRTSTQPDGVTAGLAAALTMGLVDSLFSGNLTMPHSQMLFCVIAGWIVGRSNPMVGAPVPAIPGFRAVRTGLAGVAFLAAMTTLILTVEYLDVIHDMPYPFALRAPSFWQYGRFDAW